MIMILGSTHDDILYFESVMTNKREETVLERYTVQIGTIFNQEVVLVHDVYTSYMSALITSHIIEKYFVMLVFIVGRCVSFSPDLKQGDIALSKRVIIGDVNQTKEAGVKLGQLPGFPRSFQTEEEIQTYMIASLEKRSFTKYTLSTIISANMIFDSKAKIENIYMDGYVLGHKDNVVFDCISGGACVACHIHKIPSIVVKVVERQIEKTAGADDYIAVLKKYSDVGKAVVTCIGDIGRNDIIRGE